MSMSFNLENEQAAGGRVESSSSLALSLEAYTGPNSLKQDGDRSVTPSASEHANANRLPELINHPHNPDADVPGALNNKAAVSDLVNFVEKGGDSQSQQKLQAELTTAFGMGILGSIIDKANAQLSKDQWGSKLNMQEDLSKSETSHIKEGKSGISERVFDLATTPTFMIDTDNSKTGRSEFLLDGHGPTTTVPLTKFNSPFEHTENSGGHTLDDSNSLLIPALHYPELDTRQSDYNKK